MKILLSAYACFPNHGSEPGVGYKWLLSALNAGHEVTLLTCGWSYGRLKGDSVLEYNNLKVLVIGKDSVDKFWRNNRISYQAYIIYWQLMAAVKIFSSGWRFDIAHHLTYGGVTIPSFISFFAKKSIYGPVGGGEAAPLSLALECGPKSLVRELFKRSQQALILLDPFIWVTKITFTDIFVKNKSNNWLFSFVGHKCRVKSEIAISNADVTVPLFPEKSGPKKIAFSGRGIYWKGGMIAIKLASYFQKKYPEQDVEFHFFGEGPEFKRWKREASKAVQVSIIFHGRLDQSEYLRRFGAMDLLWFPSFHDSSGNAVLESLVMGIPVVAFDLAGPSSIIEQQEFLVDPNLPMLELSEQYVAKSHSLLFISDEKKKMIRDFYSAKFKLDNLLHGVYC